MGVLKIWIQLFFLGGCICIYSCQNHPDTAEEKGHTVIHFYSINTNALYSEVIEDVDYIVLRGLPDGEAVFHFAKVLKFEGGFICWEDRNETIYIFDNEGNYLRHINAIGGGPTEYVSIGDICYIENDHFIGIIDRAHYLIKYDLQGNGISKVELPKRSGNMMTDDNGDILFFSYPRNVDGKRDSCVLWTLGADGAVNCINLRSIEVSGGSNTGKFRFSRSNSKNEIFFTLPLSNYVYTIRNNELFTKYEIDFGDKEVFSFKDRSNYSIKEFINHVNSNEKFIHTDGNIFTASNWLVYQFNNKYYVRDGRAIGDYNPNERLLYHPKYGLYSMNFLNGNPGFDYYWRIRGTYDNVLIHHMYFSDRDKVVEEKMDLRTESGERVLDLMDETSEILVLMKLRR